MAEFVNFLTGIVHIILLFWVSEFIGFTAGISLLLRPPLPKAKKKTSKKHIVDTYDLYYLIKFMGLAAISTVSFTFSSVFRVPWWWIWFTLIVFTISYLIYIVRVYNKRCLIIRHTLSYLRSQRLLFLLYVLLVILRLQTPYFNQTERFMDSLFIYFINKRGHLPLENPWLSGVVLNYYYLGHFLLSALLKALLIPPTYGYNLLIALVTIWIVQAFYQLTHIINKLTFRHTNLPKRIEWFIALTFTFGGNFYMLFSYLAKKELWYPDASRVIPNTINEFPAYSIAVGDLHGHFVDLAFATIGIIALWVFISQTYRTIFTPNLYALALGSLLFQIFGANSWDIFPLLLASIIWVITYLIKWYNESNRQLQTLIKSLIPLLLDSIVAITAALIPFIIFKMTFLPPVRGIGFRIHHDYRWAHILWGQHIVFTILLLILVFLYSIKTSVFTNAPKTILNLIKRLIQPFVPTTSLFEKNSLALVVMLVGLLNIILVNFFFIKSIFYVLHTESYRANSVFKMYFTAWGFWGIPVTTLLLLLLKRLKIYRKLRLIILIIVTLIFTVMWHYQALLMEQAYSIRRPYKRSITAILTKLMDIPNSLDGTEYIRYISEADNKAKRFLQSETKNKPAVLLEHTDWNSYKVKPARFCTTTGNICVLGWPLHNYQWYLSLQPVVIHYPTLQKTKTDIKDRLTKVWEFYKSPTLDIITQYNVDYVILGKVEQDFLIKNNKSVIYTYQRIKEMCPEVYEFVGDDQSVTYVFKCNRL